MIHQTRMNKNKEFFIEPLFYGQHSYEREQEESIKCLSKYLHYINLVYLESKQHYNNSYNYRRHYEELNNRINTIISILYKFEFKIIIIPCFIANIDKHLKRLENGTK